MKTLRKQIEKYSQKLSALKKDGFEKTLNELSSKGISSEYYGTNYILVTDPGAKKRYILTISEINNLKEVGGNFSQLGDTINLEYSDITKHGGIGAPDTLKKYIKIAQGK
ncbi:MAG: hypothetical protein ACTSXQ_02315 [Alphaproteobacteria bacterium]